jgi:hypothetical protein
MNMRDEEPKIDKLNKRARINYHYLKDISGYDLLYYNQMSSDNFSAGGINHVRTTNAILYKKGIDTDSMVSRIKDELSFMFWDACIPVNP